MPSTTVIASHMTQGRVEYKSTDEGLDLWEAKQMQGRRVRNAVRAQEGRIFDRGSFRKTELRNRNHCYTMGKWGRSRGPTATEVAAYSV
jgi:hypothetical protein